MPQKRTNPQRTVRRNKYIFVYKDYGHLRVALNSGEIRVQDVVQYYVDRIQDHTPLNAFLEVYAEEALARAQTIQEKITDGTAGSLAGMVIGIKDNIAYKDHSFSAASRILEGFVSLFSSTAVERLLEQDAIIIGRLNCDEFAMGSSNEKSAYGPVLNPHDPTRVPGGSSGGSAAAVAADLCMAALGSDTGGSIRQPAAFCGTVGFKPSYGRVSRHGLIAYASSFDQIGPFTHNLDDTARIMQVISGSDEFDTTAIQEPAPSFLNESGSIEDLNAPLKLAYFKETLTSPGLDPEVKERFLARIADFERVGHTVNPVDFPYLEYLVPTYYVLTTAEASSNLARYDGVHYGYRSEQAHDLESTYTQSRTEGFGIEVQRRILLGTFVLSSGYYDAYYTKGQAVRRLIADATRAIFTTHDAILSPTTPHPAFELNRPTSDPTAMYLEDIFTVHANICGIPSVSIPETPHSGGLPLGLQITGGWHNDHGLLKMAKQLQTLIHS